MENTAISVTPLGNACWTVELTVFLCRSLPSRDILVSVYMPMGRIWI